MATTNKEIIAFYKAENGIQEPLHTFEGWKSRGYHVRRGEKSADKLTIWRHTVKRNKETGEETGKMILVNAAFFRLSQVERD